MKTQFLAGVANTVAKKNKKKTTSDKLIARKANNARERGLEKRKGDIYFGFSEPGRWQPKVLTSDLSTHKMDTY